MKKNNLKNYLFFIILLISCSEDDSLDSKTKLLVDFQWWNSEIVGSSPSGFSVVSPIVFKSDNSVYLGSSQAEWRFIENGRSIKFVYPGANYSDKWEIVSLTETELRYKHFSQSGDFLIELKYTKCETLPC